MYLEVGGGQIDYTNDLNSVITDSNFHANQSFLSYNKTVANRRGHHNKQQQQQRTEKSRIAHWDPYELAAKIKDQIDLD